MRSWLWTFGASLPGFILGIALDLDWWAYLAWCICLGFARSVGRLEGRQS